MNTTLTQGQTQKRPPRKKSQAHTGIQPISSLTHRTQRFQPLPAPLGEPPYHFDLENVLPGITKKAKADGKLVFHTVGDTGGIKNADYQSDVAKAMKTAINGENAPSFFYHLGDVVYYNGEIDKYYDQFYEPYDHYAAPILAIAGNHDGDPIDDTQTSLDGWVKYFMTATPHVDPISKDAPRVTLSLPNVYYTLICPYVTIIGMYTNVPEHGSIDSVQQQWLTNEFNTADKSKALIIALHHPIYSFDDHHSGSAAMADVLQHAINDTGRVPNMVLTAHVHNIQRIEKEIVKGTPTPFLVAGNGGYYHLHNLTANAGDVDENTGAVLKYGNDKEHGYVTLTVDAKQIKGVVTLVDKFGAITETDTFEYSASPLTLDKKIIANL